MKYFKIYLVLFFLGLLFNTAFPNPDSLQLYGVNNWKLLLVDPPPNNIFDTNLTGMQILPIEGSQTDSAQLFQQYGPNRRIGNEWAMGVHWNRKIWAQPSLPFPKCWLIELRVRSYVNLAYLGLGVSMTDTINAYLGMYAGPIELSPEWQVFRTPDFPSSSQDTVHKIGLDFGLFTPDSTYCGLEILLNNLWFVYENGDTILVDPFQYTFPNGIIEELPGIPTGFQLHQNYPNPFNPQTVIRYEVPEALNVKLTVYSLLGEKIVNLVDQYQNTGIYETVFDGTGLSSGTYIYILQTEQITLRKKFILLK